MDPGAVTPVVVRDALRAIRYARSLASCPLLQLDVVTVQLRKEGIADSARTREWMLGRLLDRLSREATAALRPPSSSPAGPQDASGALTAAAEIEAVRQDFRAGSATLEAWSVLRYRYLAVSPVAMQAMADELGVSYRTLARRLKQGHEHLAAALREAELAARPMVAVAPGAPVSQRVVADPSAEEMDTPAAMATLLAAVQDDARIVRLPPKRLEELGRRAVADLVEYRLGRIAKWSDERYALDERFVELTLLVDQGEEAASGRWGAQDKRYPNLRDVLAEVEDPALVLLGPPGCGKSTLLRRFELDTAVVGLRETAQAVTFFVSLNTYRGQDPGEIPPPARGWRQSGRRASRPCRGWTSSWRKAGWCCYWMP